MLQDNQSADERRENALMVLHQMGIHCNPTLQSITGEHGKPISRMDQDESLLTLKALLFGFGIGVSTVGNNKERVQEAIDASAGIAEEKRAGEIVASLMDLPGTTSVDVYYNADSQLFDLEPEKDLRALFEKLGWVFWAAGYGLPPVNARGWAGEEESALRGLAFLTPGTDAAAFLGVEPDLILAEQVKFEEANDLKPVFELYPRITLGLSRKQ